MNPREIFEAWKARKSHEDVSRELTDRVMVAIRRREATRALGDLAPLRSMAARPRTKAAALILGILLGLGRIIATLHLILSA
jgi:ferric-dicitrate binding protein FerR (iron transport regulator)